METKSDSREERQSYTVVSSQSVLHSPDAHKDSQNWFGKIRGKEETEVFSGRKRRVRSGRDYATPS